MFHSFPTTLDETTTLLGTNIFLTKGTFESMIFRTSPGGICIRSLEGTTDPKLSSMSCQDTWLAAYHGLPPGGGWWEPRELK